jgi:pimeloyl-ACP methyl ester carboxylesterase
MKHASALVIAVLVSSVCFAQAPSTQPTPSFKGTYLLVHGAWGGGWAFREVDRLLTEQGYRVYRPTLTGQGERSHLSSPNIDLNNHIQDIVNVIQWEQLKDVILVGHSYGGMVVTGVADRVPDKIKHLIYLDAFLPENGESADVMRKMATDPLNVTERDGFLIPTWLRPDAPIPHDVNMPAKTFSQPIELKHQEAARKIPTSYILTVDPGKQPQDDLFYSSYQRAQSRGWNVMTMIGDHNVQWSRPKELARYLIEAPTAKAPIVSNPPSSNEATPLGAPTVGLPAGKANFVLVHGAWGGGMDWKTVDELLSADGHHVRRASLTGQGQYYNLSNPDIDLTTHINDVVNVILWDDLHDVVLVGHSYGGMVITGVVDRVPDRIKKIVYVDAFLPENGESLNTVNGRGGGRGPATGPTSAPALARGGARAGAGARRGGGANVPPGFSLFGNFDPDKPPPKDVPQSEKTFSEPLNLKNQDAVAKIPHTYILTVDPGRTPEQDQFAWAYQRARAKGWKLLTIEGGHNIHMEHPRELVKMLEAEVP